MTTPTTRFSKPMRDRAQEALHLPAIRNVIQARDRKTRLILPVLILLGSFGLLSYISVQTPISYDEAVYIVAGDFALYYPFAGRGGNFEHPVVGKMIIGLALLATGHLVNEPVWHGWNPEAWQTSIPQDVLLSARLAPTALTSLTCVLLYMLASKRSPSRGIFTALLFLLNPLVLGNGYRALLDPVLTFFVTLTWAVLVENNKWAEPLNWKASILYGLGFATKYTATILFPALLAYVLLGAEKKGRIKLLKTALTFPPSAYIFGCIFSPFGLGDLGFLRQDWHGGWLGYANYFYVRQGRFFSLDSLGAEFAWTFKVVFLGGGAAGEPNYLALCETALFIAALLYLTIRNRRKIAEPERSSLFIFTISLLSLSLFTGKNAYYMILLAPWYASILSIPLESAAQRLGRSLICALARRFLARLVPSAHRLKGHREMRTSRIASSVAYTPLSLGIPENRGTRPLRAPQTEKLNLQNIMMFTTNA